MVNVALIQQVCVDDKEKNIQNAISKIELAVEKGAKIICLQELFSCEYFPKYINKGYFALAEPISGNTINIISKLAKKNKAAIIAPIFEKYADGIYYDTAVVLGTEGQVLGVYRKAHIPYSEKFQEKYYFKPGNTGYPVFQTEWGQIGILICYDRHFPEAARELGLKSAEIVFVPSATTESYKPSWEFELQAHAHTNSYFMCGLNRVGREGDSFFFGNSFIADPSGNILAKGGGIEEIIIAEINIEEAKTARLTRQYFRDRRPDTYRLLIE